MGTFVLAELPLGAPYMGTFVASPKRPLTKSRRNTGAMASSQSCELSGPAMADAVVAVTIFQQHFPSMLAM